MMTAQEFKDLNRHYDELLDRLVKGANFLDNPLIKPEVYEAGMKKFERIWNEAMEVRERYWNHVLGGDGACTG